MQLTRQMMSPIAFQLLAEDRHVNESDNADNTWIDVLSRQRREVFKKKIFVYEKIVRVLKRTEFFLFMRLPLQLEEAQARLLCYSLHISM